MKKNGRIIGKILLAIVVLALLALGASGLIQSRLSRNEAATVYHADLEGYENAEYAPVGNGFCAVSEIAVRLFGTNGETIMSLPRNYPEGTIASCASGAAVWEPGGTEITILQSNGDYTDLTFSGGITNADMNEEGCTVILAGEKGYKGSVNVILPNGEASYRVYVGSGYPLDADLSADSTQVAILSLTAEGSRVSLYATNRENPIWEWTDSGVYFELEYLSGGKLCLLSENKAVFLTADGKKSGEYSFSGEYLKDYATTGDHGVVLALGKYQTGAAGRLVLLDWDGNASAKLDLSAEVASISAVGEYAAVRYTDQIVIYDKELHSLGSLSSVSGAQAAFLRSDGSAVIISGGGAAIFET